MINKISFISYSVSDLERSIVFYRDLLGLKLLLNNDTWAEFNIDGQRLAIHKEKINSDVNHQSGATVYFEAIPIENMIKALQSKGIIFNGEVEVYPYGKLILFSDLDNNSLGLYEPPKHGTTKVKISQNNLI